MDACPPPADHVCDCRRCRAQLAADLHQELREAVEAATRGETVGLGDFSQYADGEDDR